ncbi:MAG: hypothetical protein CMA45_00460 [Euryarchaeota archaeon]|nr:hypothetical protein [Euryarchaeota archaeon]
MTGSSHGKDGKLIATLLVALMAFSVIPIMTASAEDYGDPMNLQAQDIAATFDTSTELTTITWRNIDSPGAELNNIFDAVYNIYRHTENISRDTIGQAQLIYQVDACNPSQIGGSTSRYDCMAFNGSHPGHSFSYLVSPGTNDTFYYAITTTISTVGTSEELIFNESSLYHGVQEVTTPIRTPYNLQASFDALSSTTTLNWVNYNDIFPILPENGPDAYSTRIWKTTEPLTRQTAFSLLSATTPIANLSAGVSTYVVDVPAQTDSDYYYSITYFLPNWTNGNQDYEDIRFLSNNALTSPITEDNLPPQKVSSVTTAFIPDSATGGGKTIISWDEVETETGESYAIYSSGSMFNNTTSFGPTIISIVPEGQESLEHQLPIGRLGHSTYCVVVIDVNGVFDTNIPPSSCSTVYEDAFYNWTAEPTQVSAEFIGNATTVVQWKDQLGAEGEVYHIWRSDYLVSGSQFVPNQTVFWMASVPDGIQIAHIEVPAEVDRLSFYFVTSEALYQHVNGTYHYTSLVQNWAGAIAENTVTPSNPLINSLTVDGESNLVMLEWLNNGQIDFEQYTVWKHWGSPFGEDEDQPTNISFESGWQIYDAGIIDSGASWHSHSFSRTYNIQPEIEREAWFAVTISDMYGNENLEARPGSGGNALKIKEDSIKPTANYTLYDGNDNRYNSPSLVSGNYKIIVTIDEYLLIDPRMEITTETGGVITGGMKQMLSYADNLANDELGPQYYLTFSISNTVSAGTINFNMTLTDESQNANEIQWDNRSLDATNPSMQVYSPASGSDGSKYLYGNSIQLLAGVTDDVQVSSFQYRFTYNYGSGSTSTSPWTTPDEIQDIFGDNSSLVMDVPINAGNFESGQHAVTFRAIDSAGNQVLSQVIFVVDNCRNRLDGTTVCNYEESLKPEPEPVIVNPSYSDPPYVMVWVLSGIVFFSLVTMLLVIRTSMKSPKKSSGDDEDEDDWMSEFIGTTQTVDMDELTQTQPTQKELPTIEEEEEEEEDPFAVNVPTRKSRRRKAPVVEEEEEDEDDDPFFGLDDEEEEEKPKKRQVGRRTAPKNAPKRRQVGRRKKSSD